MSKVEALLEQVKRLQTLIFGTFRARKKASRRDLRATPPVKRVFVDIERVSQILHLGRLSRACAAKLTHYVHISAVQARLLKCRVGPTKCERLSRRVEWPPGDESQDLS